MLFIHLFVCEKKYTAAPIQIKVNGIILNEYELKECGWEYLRSLHGIKSNIDTNAIHISNKGDAARKRLMRNAKAGKTDDIVGEILNI